MNRQRLDGLSSLRGWAAALVVIVHVWGINPLPPTSGFQFVANFFPLGVALFFVISAFSLYVSTSHRIGDDGWVSAFAVRRFMRIAPLFYLIAVFYLLVVPLINGGPFPFRFFFLTVSFLFNFLPGQHVSLVWAGWSVGVEMLFYLVLPIVFVLTTGLRTATVLLLLTTAVSSLFIQEYRSPNYPAYYAEFSFMGSVGIFSWGVFAYFVYLRLQPHRHVALIARLILLLSVLGAWFLVSSDGKFSHLPVTRALLWGPVLAGMVLSQCLRSNYVLTNPVMNHLGTLSFSLYLCHPPLIYYLHPVFLQIYQKVVVPEIAILLCVTLTCCLLYPIARIMFEWVEQPGIRAGEWLIRRWRFVDSAAS